MTNLEGLRNRRKAVLYGSSGYDFNPFDTSRLQCQAERFGIDADRSDFDPFLEDAVAGQPVRGG